MNTAASVIALPGLWGDIDIQSPAHQASNLPRTITEAWTLFQNFPLQPSIVVDSGHGLQQKILTFPQMVVINTIVVDSGHGLQPWWLFRELWIFDDDAERQEAQQLARRFLATLQAKAMAQGWCLDPVADLARVLRVPRTFNRKLAPVPVRVIAVKDARYNPSDFEPYLLKFHYVPRNNLAAAPGLIPNGTVHYTFVSWAGTMHRRGMSSGAILAALLHENRTRCDPIRPEKNIWRIVESVTTLYGPGAIPEPQTQLTTFLRLCGMLARDGENLIPPFFSFACRPDRDPLFHRVA